MAAWRSTGALGKATARLRNRPLARITTAWRTNRQDKYGLRCPDFRQGKSQEVWPDKLCKPARVVAQPAVVEVDTAHGAYNFMLKLRDDSRPPRPARYDTRVMGDTVSRLLEQGHLRDAVEALGCLVETDRSVPKSLFYNVLKRCAIEKDLVLGRRVHAFAVDKGYQSDTILCNHMLRMYAAHGRLQDAMNVFVLVAKPDAYTWSAIISAHVKHGQDKQAIQLYRQMRRSGVKPDGHVFVAALQASARGGDLKAGKQVHADVLATGVEPHLYVSSSLVDMYAKCGNLEDAQRVFDGLGRKDAVTWNAMIAGYSQKGMGQEALRLYSAMEEEGTAVPTSVTFVSLLQACANLGTQALEVGRQLHAQIRARGHQSAVNVANSLVNMYAKCGSLDEAQRVFDGLCQKDVVTWTAMIAGYSQQGMGHEALRLYTAMQRDGISIPNTVTFVCLLQACATVGTPAFEMGKQLHLQIRERGHQADVSVANGLVNMYSKCGSLEDARRVFDGLAEKDVVTWNSMIAGYSQHGTGQEALYLYSAMQEEGKAVPDGVSFVCLLQACARVGAPALETGKQLHLQIRDGGHDAAVFVANSLVSMYAKCGSPEDSRKVFDEIQQKDIVTWNAMIAGYAQHGMGQQALRLYTVMREECSAVPDSVTIVHLLQACAGVGNPALENGKQLHAEIRERGQLADMAVANNLLNMYAKCGSLEEAHIVFDGLGQKDVLTWNTMIAGYSQQGRVHEALCMYKDMEDEGLIVPNSMTFVRLLQACASMGPPALEKGKQLHVLSRERGHQADVFVANSLVNMYAKCGSLEDSRNVFDGFSQRDVVTWNAMMAGYSQQGLGQEALHLYDAMQAEGVAVPDSVTFVSLLQACASVGREALRQGEQLHAHIREQGHEDDVFVANSLVNMYAKCGNLERARRLFDALGQKDVVTWTAMITGYSQQGMGQEALRLSRVMQDESVAVPDSVTLVCLLQACANVAALHLGRQLHAQIVDQGLQADLFVASSLINMYGKCGSMIDAQNVFDELPVRDVVAWTALIGGYTSQGDCEAVFDLVQKMRQDGKQPVSITLLSVLTVCSHAGLVNKGREYFEAMGTEYGIAPTVEHYTCMVDLLGRSGQLDEALGLIRTMAFVPNATVWRTLLGACQKWSNVEVGRRAFDYLVKLESKDSAAYVLMSNIYRGAQMWEQAKGMQARRIRMRAWKQPGQSWWTDVDGLVHTFLVGEAGCDSHQRLK